MTVVVRRTNGELPDVHDGLTSACRDAQGYLVLSDCDGVIATYAPGDWLSVVRQDEVNTEDTERSEV